MKVNAPEKIYVVDATFPDYVDFDGSPINTKRIDDHDIEYIQPNAFIDNFVENAWDWVEDNILSSNQQDKSRLYCEQFRKYIKGE